MSDTDPAPNVREAGRLMDEPGVARLLAAVMERHSIPRILLSESDLTGAGTVTAFRRSGLDEGEDWVEFLCEPSGKVEPVAAPEPVSSRTTTIGVVGLLVVVLALFVPLVIRLWTWAL